MSLNAALLAELKHESVNTRKMIERVPTDKLDWKPHVKSMTVGRLATHIADIPAWFDRIINADEFDFSTAVFNREVKENSEAILKLFDERLQGAINLLESVSDDTLNGLWTSRQGDHVLFQLPRKVSLRNFAYNHVYHHRGQLSVYLCLISQFPECMALRQMKDKRE